MNKLDGGPAFPRSGFYDKDGPTEMDATRQDGMSLRDWFAGMAMQGFVTRGLSDKTIQEANIANVGKALDLIAIHAYAVADAMIAEREK